MKVRFFPSRIGLAAAAVAGTLVLAGIAAGAQDFGQLIENQHKAHSLQNFGIVQPVAASSQASIDAGTATADPTKLVTLAKNLKAKVVAVVPQAPNVDMMALWPNDTDPTHIIACNEQDPEDVGLVRIDLATGDSENIVASGLDSCDPVHRTAWGTIVFAEEAGNEGRLFELIDPLNTTDVDVAPDGSTSGGTNPGNIVMRGALGNLSYEGVGVYPNGIVYYGDEKRPLEGNVGGAYYKFVPNTLYDPAGGAISYLGESPLAQGTVYGLQLGKRNNADYGQGTQVGLGNWIEVTSHGDFPDLGAIAEDLHLTGYYRPEDLSIDLAALANGDVRWCGNNTGNEDVDLYNGETICLTDGTLAEAGALTSTPEVQYLVIGNPQLAMMDNMAYQPGTGNWYLHEDGEQLQGNNDLWACLDDGDDVDLLSDSCLRVGTLNDLNAEWTGGVFDASGEHFYVSVQHNVTGNGIVLEISGWK